MPTAALRFCATPGCPNRVPTGHCQDHAANAPRLAYDRHRGSARARGYDHRWDLYSKRWLARFPWCGQRQDGKLNPEHSRCVQAGLRTLAQVTDHIIPLAQGGAHRDDANSQSLCRRCNTSKGGTVAPSQSKIVVYGPPGCGKSTWVRSQANPGDLVWDLDEVAAVIGNGGHEIPRQQRGNLPWPLMKATLVMRDALVGWLARTELPDDVKAYVIIAAEDQAREVAIAIGASVVEATWKR